MDPTVLQQILDALKTGHYLPLIIILTLYVRKLASADSKFPISIPTTWLPSVSALGGLAYGFEVSIQNGASIGAALLGAIGVGASTGFFDGLMTAIFAHGQAPAWAKAIVFLVDDVAGGGGAAGGAAGGATGSKPVNAAPKPADPPKALRGRLVFAMCLVGLMGCSTLTALIPEMTTIENKICADLAANDTDVQIVNDVETILGASSTVEAVSDLVLTTITNLINSGLLAKHYPPAVVAYAKQVQGLMVTKAAARHAVPAVSAAPAAPTAVK